MIQSLPELRRQFSVDKQILHEFAVDDPRRARPFSLEQQKKRAKELLSQWRGSREWQRLSANHPEAGRLAPDSVQLADAQLVVAREAGFASWAKLKHHSVAADLARQALQSGRPAAPDADRHTLHIRCGYDVMYKLAVAGFDGDFLPFADPYIQGPVPTTGDLESFIRIRADFIVGNNWRTPDRAYAELADEYRSLEKGRDYGRIAFWFEHDAYDVLIFLKLLRYYSDPSRRAPEMRFLCASHYPGVARFNGIGQLPAEAMHVLWAQFRPLTEAQFEFGKRGWQAYTDTTPETLLELATQENPALPELIPALKRHLRELPWLKDGLGLSERLTLKILAEQGPLDAASLFYRWYTTVYEPLPFMGDSSYWVLLDKLAHAPQPAITLHKATGKVIDWHVSLTPFGRQLLAGQAHWGTVNPYDRWFGGVHNRSDEGVWYWDDVAGQLVRQSP